ncbi:MAG: uroporphyrinogen-III synthase, partial [Deltaproteobacteria bacterium]|nr:uroporphyrinogen-III synthase [Deltaproteobacteria bacterium]
AAVGRVTADSLWHYGLKADLLPENFTGEGLVEALVAQGVAAQKILIPRALEARNVLEKGLAVGGAQVTIAPVYQNLVPLAEGRELRQEIETGTIDMVTFTSYSTVHNFVTMLACKDNKELGALLAGVKIAVIGPITAQTVAEYGLCVDVQPATYTIAAMVEAIVDHAAKA